MNDSCREVNPKSTEECADPNNPSDHSSCYPGGGILGQKSRNRRETEGRPEPGDHERDKQEGYTGVHCGIKNHIREDACKYTRDSWRQSCVSFRNFVIKEPTSQIAEKPYPGH